MNPVSGLRLVADIGGTHLRMALAQPPASPGTPPQLQAVEQVETQSVQSVCDTLAAYWCRQGAPALRSAAVAVAGPADGVGRAASAQLTNASLSISAEACGYALGLTQVRLINDFAAVAHAAPLLADADLVAHVADDSAASESANHAAAEGAIVVLGPGTGLGVAAWLPGSLVVAGEGGHASLAPPDASAVPVWQWLAARDGFVAAEHVLSGPGLVALAEAVAAVRGEVAGAALNASESQRPAAVWAAAQSGNAVAVEAVRLFTTALGAYAGDLALIFGAQRVLLAGGILPRWGAGFDIAAFRRSFEAKEPRYALRLQAVTSATVVHAHPGLLGLAAL